MTGGPGGRPADRRLGRRSSWQSGASVAAGRVSARSSRQRARLSPDRVYLGWQYAPLHADPGPPPQRPVPPIPQQFSQEWLAAQRREDHRLARPARLAVATCLAAGCGVLALGLAGAAGPYLAGLGIAVAACGTVTSGRSVWRGRRDLRERIVAEQRRVATIRSVQQAWLAARQEAHAAQVRAWQERQEAFGRQPQWFAVSLPDSIDRVDVAGGTLVGWSALLTMIAAPRLSTGGDVTVLDLTEGAVARDLLAVARRSGISPLVWVLPGDLPRLDLGAGQGREALADVLAMAVAASEEPGPAGAAPAAQAGMTGLTAARDSAILGRVLGVLGASGSDIRVAQVTAALRVLGQAGDPREDLRAGLLDADQLERISVLFGRGAADRVVIERAWVMESRLRALEALGAAPVALPATRLRVVWLDRRAGALGNRVIGSYLAVALTHVLRQMPAGRPWRQTLCVLGAERLPGDVLDRLADACEMTGAGLVFAYRSLPAHVRERLGRGNAATAFMRLGNAADAKAASEQVGTEHRFVLSQLTDSVGTSFTDTTGDSYTSTVGTSDSVSDSVSVSETRGRSRGRGRSRQDTFAPFGNFTGSASRDDSYSAGISDARSLTGGISSGTSWGISTSKAAGSSSSLARATQRSREFLVEQHELQQLPPSAVIISYASAGGRRVVLADSNPGIITLPTATLRSVEEERSTAAAGTPADGERHDDWRGGGSPRSDARQLWADDAAEGDTPPPNLGPPPSRLDWRRPRH